MSRPFRRTTPRPGVSRPAATRSAVDLPAPLVPRSASTSPRWTSRLRPKRTLRLPILYALTYPDRIQSDMRFAISDLRHLDFSPPDLKKFPCLRLAYEAAEAGGAKTVALNAADEVAVAAFLDGGIRFDEIPRIIEDVLSATNSGKLESIRQVLEADALARQDAERRVASARKAERPRATSLA